MGKEPDLHLKKSFVIVPKTFWNLRTDNLFPTELLYMQKIFSQIWNLYSFKIWGI